MPLERGPFVKIPDSALPWTPGTWDNESWVSAQLADVPSYLDEISFAADTLAAIDLTDFAPEMDDGLVDVLISQGAGWLDVMSTIGDQIDGAAITGDSYFADALNEAPPGTWEDNPVFYTPPGQAPGAPAPGGPGVPAPGQTGIHLSVTPPDGYTFTIINLNQYGAAAFSVGDQFRVDLTGPAGVKVSILASHDGVSLGTIQVGLVKDDGTFTLTGYESPTEVGAWVEEWFVGNQLVAIAEFSVLP